VCAEFEGYGATAGTATRPASSGDNLIKSWASGWLEHVSRLFWSCFGQGEGSKSALLNFFLEIAVNPLETFLVLPRSGLRLLLPGKQSFLLGS
jgi:hypothetical protein